MKCKTGLLDAVCFTLLGLAVGPICGAQQVIGVGVHNGLTSSTESSLVPAGMSIRADFRWKYIESTPGVLNFDYYVAYDEAITSAVQRGAKPIIILCCAPKFYDGGDLPLSPDAVSAYVKYAKAVVNHFRGRVTQFEVWNEWNLNTGSTLQPKPWGKSIDYVNLLRVASAAIKAENPQAVVIGGSVGGTDGNWIDGFIKAGGLAYLDAFSVHPYVYRHAQNHPDGREFIWQSPGGSPLAWAAGEPEEAIAWLDQLNTRVAQSAANRRIPILITEIGWPTSRGGFGVSESIAAAYLQRFFLMARTRSWIGGVWWYDLIDDGADPSNEEARFGLVRQSQEYKPAYSALLEISDVLLSPSLLTQNVAANGEISIKGRHPNGQPFTANWLPTKGSNTQPMTPLLTVE